MKVVAIRLGTVAGLLALWALIARSGLVLNTVLPPPSDVLRAFVQLFSSETLTSDLYASTYEIGMGFAIGALGAITVGGMLGSSDYLYRLFEPLIYYFGAVPKIVLFPILILFLGTGFESKVGMGAISAFFPIVVSTALSVREINPVHVRAAKSLGANKLQLWSKVYTPAILGPLLSGLRLGLAVSITATLLAETKVAQEGLGFRAVQLYSQLRITEMYALLLLVFVIAAVVNAGLSYLIARATHYQQQAATGTTSVM